MIADYTLFNGAASCVLLNGSALMLGQAKRPPLLLNGMQSGDGPFMLAVTFAYDKPTDEGPSILRWALQPLASAETPLPVASWPERLIVIEMARCLDNIDPNISTRYQLWLHKPVLPMVDRMTGVWIQPAITLMAKDSRGERCRVAFRLQGRVTISRPTNVLLSMSIPWIWIAPVRWLSHAKRCLSLGRG